jgi:hypothetical protein
MEELVVNGVGVVEDGSHYALDMLDVGVIKGWASVWVRRVLGGGTIGDRSGLVGRKATFFRVGVVVLDKESVNVVMHGEATGASSVVPGQVDAGIEVAMPVFGEVVVLLYDVMEVVGMLNADIFHTKVIYDEGEHDGSPFVSPEAGDGIKLVVACLVEAFLEEFVG